MSSTITEKNSGPGSDVASQLHTWGDVLAKNSRTILIFILGFFVVAGVGTYMMSQRDNRSEQAKNALFLARESMTKELKAIAAVLAPPPATPAKPAAKTPDGKDAAPAKPAEPDPTIAQFAKVDVDAKFPETVKKLQAVTQDYKGTRAAYEARIMLGNLYISHGEPAKAVGYLEEATKDAPHSQEKGMSWMSLGYAYENSGKNAEAITAFEKALSQGGDSLKGELLLAIARNQELTKDFAKARSTYDRISSELPNTETARTADTFKAQLPQ